MRELGLNLEQLAGQEGAQDFEGPVAELEQHFLGARLLLETIRARIQQAGKP